MPASEGDTMTKINIPEVSPTRVSVDLDVNPDGHLANVSCLPGFMSNDYALIYSKVEPPESRAFCARFFGEAGGVVGEDYANCISADGEIFAVDENGNKLSGSTEEKGKERLASLLAQTYDCYVQQLNPNELAQFLWNVDINDIDVAQLSRLMWKYEPLIEETALPVDIDQDSKNLFPPTLGAVTADPTMVDDVAIIWKPELNPIKGILEYCFTFESEVAPPYGNSGEMCIFEDGSIFAPSLGAYPSNEHTRLIQNIGNALNGYFASSTTFAQDLVNNAATMSTPAEAAPKEETIEEQEGIVSIFVKDIMKSQREAFELCPEDPINCGYTWNF